MRGDDRDDLIDAAAHAMTRGEPSVQLRHKVRVHIDKPAAWPAVVAWVPALAGATAMVLAVLAWWTPAEPPPPQPVAIATPAPQTAPPQPAPRIAIAATQPQAPPRSRVTRP